MRKLDDLLRTNKSYSGTSIEEMFMKTLHVEAAIQFFSGDGAGRCRFKFSDHYYGSTFGSAVYIAKSLCFDTDLIKQRQECLKYMMNHENFDELYPQALQILENYLFLCGVNPFKERMGWGAKRAVDIYSVNQYVQGYKGFLDDLKSFGEITENSQFHELVDFTEGVKDNLFNRVEEDYPFTTEKEAEDAFNHLSGFLGGGIMRDMVYSLDYFTGYAARLREISDSLVFPEVINGARVCSIEEGIHPVLYLGENRDREKVPNDFNSDEMNLLKIITGENENGKTMAIKTRGIIQVLAQAGLPVIAKKATLTPVTRIFANIGQTEDTLEAKSTYKNINSTTFEMIKRATAKTLLLLDEPTLGTYDVKSISQMKVYLDELAFIGSEAWIVTHHLELANYVERYPHAQNLTAKSETISQPINKIISFALPRIK